MMPTDTERREVARSLREIPDSMTYSADRIGKTVLEMFSPNGVFHGNGRRAFNRLADLIEPSIPMDPGEAGLACVDAFIREHTEKPVDRDALMELADEMENNTWYETGFDRQIAVRFARRIREALGMES